jgi:hypothetical protein
MVIVPCVAGIVGALLLLGIRAGVAFDTIWGTCICGWNVTCVPMGTLVGGDCRIKVCTAPLSFITMGMRGCCCGVISVTVMVMEGI